MTHIGGSSRHITDLLTFVRLMSHPEIGFLLLLLLYGALQWAANAVFVRRARVLEDLLGARLQCRFFGVYSDVKACGVYRERRIRFESLARWRRVSWFILKGCELQRQKRFLISYPKVTPNVYQRGNKLVIVWQGSALGQPHEFERSQISAILDELVYAAETAEAAREREGGKKGGRIRVS